MFSLSCCFEQCVEQCILFIWYISIRSISPWSLECPQAFSPPFPSFLGIFHLIIDSRAHLFYSSVKEKDPLYVRMRMLFLHRHRLCIQLADKWQLRKSQNCIRFINPPPPPQIAAFSWNIPRHLTAKYNFKNEKLIQ